MDLVERLRRHISRLEMDDDDQVALVPRWEVEEAADEIERLNRLVDSLRAEVALLTEHQPKRVKNIDLREERDRPRAEVAR